MTSTKKIIQKTPSSSSRTLTIASALDADVPTDATPPRSEGNKQLLFLLLIVMYLLLSILFGTLRYSFRRNRRGGRPRNRLSNISDSPGILLVHPSLSNRHLTLALLSHQIQHLPSKRARTTASPIQVTQSSFLF